MTSSSGRRLLNRATAELVSWLNIQNVQRCIDVVKPWREIEWNAMRHAILSQGLGPYLHKELPGTPLYACLPATIQDWLASQYDRNEQRMARLQGELATILQRANRAGIPVMPLKGSTIAWRNYPHPAMRPMADIDILVCPEDLEGVQDILCRSGYVLSPEDRDENVRPLTFMKPGDRVVSAEGEHPDNPRPVEVHWRLRRGAWGNISASDFTDQMWANATNVEIFGESAWQPEPNARITYVAYHATSHLLAEKGRAIQWLDLALLSAEQQAYIPEEPDYTYPSLRLTQRAIPQICRYDLTPARQQAHPRIVTWADEAPLDSRCGLTVGGPVFQMSRPHRIWRRWRPSPWRIRLGYYDSPLPLAYLRHFASIQRRALARLRTRMSTSR